MGMWNPENLEDGAENMLINLLSDILLCHTYQFYEYIS